MRKILLFGENGQVAWELQRSLANLGELFCFGSKDVNLTEPDSIVSAIEKVQPQIIVNAAAYTAVDKAESEADIAMSINGTAPGIMAEHAKKLGAVLVHYSTDYVYRGNADRPYVESAELAPQSVYGQTKLVGDQAIESTGCDHLIFRTSWVYAGRGNNFFLTMKRLMAERDALNIVGDQVGSPTWCRTIAEVTGQILSQGCQGQNGYDINGQQGVYHLSCEGQASWFEFACEIKRQLRLECELSAIPTAQYPTPAARPLYSVMSGDKLVETFGLRCPSWQQAFFLCQSV
jgi:dTDP-4-dehydrorhamnose reductase